MTDKEKRDYLNKDNQESSSTEELKQQAGDLLKAAGGLAGSFGKLAKQKGSELKDKLEDEDFQRRALEGIDAFKSKATEKATKATEIITEQTAKATERVSEITDTTTKNIEERQEQIKREVASSGNNTKKIALVALIVVLAIAGIIAIWSGNKEDNNATEQPVAEEINEENTGETDEQSDTPVDSEETAEEPESLYYSSNTSETVKDGDKGVYAYKRRGDNYDQYYIIDFDEGCVYYFNFGQGDEQCDRVKIESGNLNDGLVITYHDGGDEWSYGLRFNYKNNPDKMIMQDNNGEEYDYIPTGLADALEIRDKLEVRDY